MPEFVVERDMPGVGQLSPFQQEQAIRRTCSTLHGVAPDVAWVKSYITANKCYCVFEAPSAQKLHDLIEQWGLPRPISINEVHQIVGPDVG